MPRRPVTLEPIYLDSRVGSRELFPELLPYQIPVELITLPFGDVCFVGRGHDGPVPIGVERKTIRDLSQSLVTERLTGHQLPGLSDDQVYRFRWLLIEGVWRASDGGFIEVPGGKKGEWKLLQPQLRADGLEGWLLTLELRGGVRVHRCRDLTATAAWLAVLYHWWTGKAWAEHRGHLALGTQPDPTLFNRPGLARRVAAELPGIGYEKSQDVERQFPTVEAMVAGSEAQWRTIPGIGPVLAARAYRSLREP